MTGYLTHKIDLNSVEVPSIFDELSFWSSRFGALFFEHVELRHNTSILDLGCATGFPLFELAHVCGRSCRLVGVDVWKEALVRARSKLQIYDLANVNIVEADGARLPFAEAAFDLIVSNLGINNFNDPRAVLEECFRVARPGARIALTTNVRGHMQEFYAVFRQILADAQNAAYLERLEANEAHRGTPGSVSGLLEASGFKVVKHIESSFRLRYLDGTALLNHPLTRLGFLEGWRGVVDPSNEQQIFVTLEKRLNDLAVQQGDLRMTVPMLYIEAEKPGEV